jgi:hypothetical protein
MPVLKGMAYWAFLATADTRFDKNTFHLDIALDEETVKDIKANNPELAKRLKNKQDDRGDFLTLGRKLKTRKGNVNTPPKLLDAKKNELDPHKVLVGNGSKVVVAYSEYDVNVGGYTKGYQLNAVQVLHLVPYLGKNSDELTEVDGFVYQGPSGVSDVTEDAFGLNDEIPDMGDEEVVR